jgi:Fe-S cluster biogenesis protein NfuA
MTTTYNGRDSAGPDTLEQLASRIDRAAATVDKLDHQARDSAHELQHAIEAFHKEALTRMVRRLKDDPRGKELLFEMVDDPLIYALFVRHAIVRPNIIMRVSRVLDLARPYIRSHGGDVELVEVRDNVVYVRLHGSCNGCSLSAVTLRNEIEAALRNNIPEITGVQVVAAEAAPALIMPESIGVRDHLAGWVAGPPTSDVPPGAMYRLRRGSRNDHLSLARLLLRRQQRRMPDRTTGATGAIPAAHRTGAHLGAPDRGIGGNLWRAHSSGSARNRLARSRFPCQPDAFSGVCTTWRLPG